MSTANPYNLKCSGFCPSLFENTRIHSEIMKLYEYSPSDSFISFSLSRHNHKFQGILKVSSHQKVFTATSRSKHLEYLLQHLSEDIGYQVNKWKRKRFVHYLNQ